MSRNIARKSSALPGVITGVALGAALLFGYFNSGSENNSNKKMKDSVENHSEEPAKSFKPIEENYDYFDGNSMREDISSKGIFSKEYSISNQDNILINTGDLARLKINWHEGKILMDRWAKRAYDGTIPKELFVNPKLNLQQALEYKIDNHKMHGGIVNQMKNMVDEYDINKVSRISIEEILGNFGDALGTVNDGLNWQQAKNYITQNKKEIQSKKSKKRTGMEEKLFDFFKNFSYKDIDLIEKIADSYDEKDMLAYAMTEIFPSNDGNRNEKMLEFVLKNYGREYLDLFPAMADKKGSLGWYQFTEYALYHVNDIRGASIINLLLPKQERIPGSVLDLKWDDHIKAAHLFSIYNWAQSIRQMSDKQKTLLNKSIDNNHDELVQIMATMHHNPGRSYRATKNWLNKGAPKGKYAGFVRIQRTALGDYAIKTKNNLEALNSDDEFTGKYQIPKEFTPPGFKSTLHFNNRGFEVFRYIVSKDDSTTYNISEKFDKFDGEFNPKTKDLYDNTGWNNIVDKHGNPIKKLLEPGKEMYFIAKRLSY